ncbi:MAG: S9 family peptidase [Bacteroidota bacterium]
MKRIFIYLAVYFPLIFWSQSKITLEDLYKNGTFRPAYLYGFNSMKSGEHYSDFDELGNLCKYEFKSGNKIEDIVRAEVLNYKGKMLQMFDYQFSADESKILFKTASEPIYRRSSVDENFIIDLKSKTVLPVSDSGTQMFAEFSPDGKQIAFVRDNNIYISTPGAEEKKITEDGAINKIKNGWSDWVYEEEFEFAKAFWWNSDGSKIAFLRFDESEVKEFSMTMYEGLYTEQYKFKYPKAGDANSLISLHIYDLKSGKTTKVDIGKETDIYIPRVKWTQDPDILSYQRMNRLQNKNELFFWSCSKQSNDLILTEQANTYVDVHDNLVFLQANKGFIWTSEKDGFKHIYHYAINGKLINQITKGNWDVTEFNGIDENGKKIYYTSTENSAIERDLYVISLDGKKKKMLSIKRGTTDAQFSNNFKYYFSTWSDANTPMEFALFNSDGKLLKVLEDNSKLIEKIKNYNNQPKEFFKFKTSENIELNGWVIKPKDFDPQKKYPVYMFGYGGPGSNECNNQWEGERMWHEMLSQEGYMVVCVDGRGTQGRGREFKHSTYLQLGKLETIDQIEAAKYLGSLPFVDKNRIGFQGWSFGGYLASLLITKGSDYFKACIAVAPVTNWRYYDNIYTERFMRTPQENAKGYDDNSPINFTKMIKGNYLLIHGSGDDNVHYQNSMEMSKELIKNNVPFDMMTYPDKNHGIYGGNTRLHLFTKILKFVKENL